ncbi:LLM class flavin-dependent oxidoreductase [Nocardia farcinica]|uniref:LLM class flavin-dependent oxidoreductase n=1 Tax=Nocardia farcinica TaxID=37329 RepID=UPI00189491A8|nr:LLM class flavin-dependent oxidoreductase [Nocardia farcinica]MBF6070643.1 LLM class flavin-dependent oxidoreductase [Nocardia farcinica]MBF6233527.1 LLM class flavin-dependent oxidoreductase [Nocardia farcinica]MBF6257776.1 LLM class flavin-dependent oxidoreductase [Nocardia farcinica]MBF6521518.1 LLM class flavin-dependent oxidoreductase [Nocardia farcinica]
MVEFIGHGMTNSFDRMRSVPFDHSYTREVVAAFESNNWDSVLFQYDSFTADPSVAAAYAAVHTERLNIVVAVRPNTCAPTYMAKVMATLDVLTQGRMRLHVVAGGYSASQAAEGDFLDKHQRYERVAEFIDLCRHVWRERRPFNYSGEHYRVENFLANIRCVDERGLMVSTGGSSDDSLRIAARHSDRHAVWALPYAQTENMIDTIREHCRRIGRPQLPSIQMQFRCILGRTRAEARAKAVRMLDAMRAELGGRVADRVPQTGGEVRAREVLDLGEWHDECFWAGPVFETGGLGSSTVLVGTAEEVAAALCHYAKLGVDAFSFSGYDTVPDAVEFGRTVIPLVKAAADSEDRWRGPR